MKFFRYVVNGGCIGVFSWFLQGSIFFLLASQNFDSAFALRASISIAFVAALIGNYWSQIHFVFKKKGTFKVFAILNVMSILIISELSVAITKFQNIVAFIDLNYYAYPVVAITTAPIIFYIKNQYIFNRPFPKKLKFFSSLPSI